MRNRKRSAFRIRFLVRYCQKSDTVPRPLQIRLTMDGRKVTDYNSGILVRPDKWNQTTQLVVGRSRLADEANERLAEIELQHREIFRELTRG